MLGPLTVLAQLGVLVCSNTIISELEQRSRWMARPRPALRRLLIHRYLAK